MTGAMTWAFQPKAPANSKGFETQAYQRFLKMGYPTHRMEEWRTTSLTSFAKAPFREATPGPVRIDAAAEGRIRFELDRMPGHRMVFINGFYSNEYSVPPPKTTGVKIEQTRAQWIEGKLKAEIDESDSNPLVWLNAAHIHDGISLTLDKGAHLSLPLHIVNIALDLEGAAPGPQIVFPRNQIRMGDGASATVIESFIGFGQNGDFTNAVTQIEMAPHSKIEHFKVENSPLPVFSTLRIKQSEETRFESHTIAIGQNAGVSRTESSSRLGGRGAEAIFNGIIDVGGNRHVDHQIFVEHVSEGARSDQHYRAILGGRAVGVFTGKVKVHPGANQTVARQLSRTLLLSNEATMQSRPQLEIDADDVQCSHGATIGQVDAAALFYLRSRGLSLADAQRLLTEAFGGEVFLRMKSQPVRNWIGALMGNLADV